MLKFLACLFMLIDHIGYYFEYAMSPTLYLVMRSIGRLAFPIFAWSVARGCARTHNPFHYFLRMCLFAIPTEILFRFLNQMLEQAFNNQANLPLYPTNVMITFALAIILVFGYQMVTRAGLDVMASLRPISASPNTAPTAPRFDVRINLGGIELDSRLGLAIGTLMIALSVTATALIQPDYSLFGIATVLLFFVIHERVPEKQQAARSVVLYALLTLFFAFINIIASRRGVSWFAFIECLSIVGVPLCYWFSREKKPVPLAKYAVYVFYPLHVTVLALLYLIIRQGIL